MRYILALLAVVFLTVCSFPEPKEICKEEGQCSTVMLFLYVPAADGSMIMVPYPHSTCKCLKWAPNPRYKPEPSK